MTLRILLELILILNDKLGLKVIHRLIILITLFFQLRPDDSIMAKTAEKEIIAVQDYIRKLSIVSTKGPQANAPTEFLEEKTDPQVMVVQSQLCYNEPACYVIII